MQNAARISVFAVVLAAFALLAASVGVSGAPAGSAVAQTGQTGDVVQVKIVINRFARQGRRIVAHGAVIGRHESAEGIPSIVRRPFTARVRASRISYAGTTRICDVLELDLRALHLSVLGLIIDLDRVHLTITANSNGGLLGSLFCSLAGGSAVTPAKLGRTATKMTRAARQQGMDQQGVANFRVNVAPGLAQAPAQVCEILDLVLGPLNLNLLGLMIRLDRVHLRITADPNGGILGSLLCSLAGGPQLPAPATPVAARTG
jgi:hypothetical protein